MATATIAYLGEIRVSDGQAHDGWAGGVCYDMRKVPVRGVDPTIVQLPHDLPIRIGWGDRPRSRDPRDIAVWCVVGDIELSRSMQANRVVGSDRYPCDLPNWADEFAACVAAVHDAAEQAYRRRADVKAVVDSYIAVLQQLDERDAAHAARWQHDRAQIAKRFRRKVVQIGEQTVPGKVCVRSARGKLLGYALCWDGRWLGKVERLSA